MIIIHYCNYYCKTTVTNLARHWQKKRRLHRHSLACSVYLTKNSITMAWVIIPDCKHMYNTLQEDACNKQHHRGWQAAYQRVKTRETGLALYSGHFPLLIQELFFFMSQTTIQTVSLLIRGLGCVLLSSNCNRKLVLRWLHKDCCWTRLWQGTDWWAAVFRSMTYISVPRQRWLFRLELASKCKSDSSLS